MIEFTWLPEEERAKLEELIKNFDNGKDVEEAAHNKPGSFPVTDEDIQGVEVRPHRYSKTNRPQTFTTSPLASKKEVTFDVKGPFKLEIGDEICTKIKPNERLILQDGDLKIHSSLPLNRYRSTVKTNVNLQKGTTTAKTRRDVEMKDVQNHPYKFHFESTKDAKNFADMEKSSSVSSEKTSIKYRLLKLLGKRSSRDLLESKGIIRNEEIFGNTLRDLYVISHGVPEFIVKIVGLIEEKENIRCLGLYRTSPNLAIVQKIRCEVDCGRLDILETYRRDVDVLCGTLKLFFRELKDPLIPYEVYLKLQAAIENPSDNKHEVESIIETMPTANKETLLFMIKHLLKVCEHKSENKMDIFNVSVSWGPSLIAIPENCSDLVIQTTQFYKVTEFLLNHYSSGPKPQTQQTETSRDGVNDTDHCYEVVKKLTQLIEENLGADKIYLKDSMSSDKIEKVLKKIRTKDEGLDNLWNKIRSKYDVDDFCSILKRFVRDLPEPLIPYSVFDQYCNDCDNYNENLLKETVHLGLELNPKKTTLTLLLNHLNVVLKHRDYDKSYVDNMTSAWSQVLMNPREQNLKQKLEKFWTFFEVLLNFNDNLPDVVMSGKNDLKRESKYDNVDDIEDVRGEADILDEKTDSYRTKL